MVPDQRICPLTNAIFNTIETFPREIIITSLTMVLW